MLTKNLKFYKSIEYSTLKKNKIIKLIYLQKQSFTGNSIFKKYEVIIYFLISGILGE